MNKTHPENNLIATKGNIPEVLKTLEVQGKMMIGREDIRVQKTEKEGIRNLKIEEAEEIRDLKTEAEESRDLKTEKEEIPDHTLLTECLIKKDIHREISLRITLIGTMNTNDTRILT
jgi:hypothetical protein